MNAGSFIWLIALKMEKNFTVVGLGGVLSICSWNVFRCQYVYTPIGVVLAEQWFSSLWGAKASAIYLTIVVSLSL